MVTILVRDLDKSLEFYETKLGFEKRQDLKEPNSGFRWLTISPPNQKELEIVLRRPFAGANELIIAEVDSSVGKGTLWTFSTSDCEQTYNDLKVKGVSFLNPPTRRPQGIEAQFEDLDGNRFSILQIN